MYLRPIAFFLLACACASGAAELPGARRQLQLQQQQDALNLNLQQALRAPRYDIGPADARRLEQLQLQQRMAQRELEQQQIQREFLLRRSGALPDATLASRLDAQREAFAAERQLQLQRFDLEQQRLLQSAPRQPLQPPVGSPQLNLP
jgi:hypothetical protein